MLITCPLFIPVTDVAGIGNTLKGFISALSLTNDVCIVPNKNAMLGDYTMVLDASHIGSKDGRESFSTCRFLVLKYEENEQRNLNNEFSNYNTPDMDNRLFWYLFSTRSMIDWYYDRTLICDHVFNRIMSAIDKIKWGQLIIDEVNKYKDHIPPSTLGVSVRSWTAPHERNINRPYSSSVYIDAIRNTLNNNNIECIFMSYDNTNIKYHFNEVLNGKHVIEYIKPVNISELQYAVIKMLLLSKCNYFICNRISTYSELVFWFSRCKQRVVPLY